MNTRRGEVARQPSGMAPSLHTVATPRSERSTIFAVCETEIGEPRAWTSCQKVRACCPITERDSVSRSTTDGYQKVRIIGHSLAADARCGSQSRAPNAPLDLGDRPGTSEMAAAHRSGNYFCKRPYRRRICAVSWSSASAKVPVRPRRRSMISLSTPGS
jgi:hypothetical protein